MKQEIARLSAGRPRTALERDLHDVEVESRTLARVVRAAERVVVGLDVHDGAAGAVRALLAVFFDPGELPAALRPAVDEPSETRLIDAPEEDVAGG